jgi:hypothetical protein
MPTGLFKSVSGEGEAVWPAPIGKEFDDATAAFELIREKAMGISQWCLDEHAANNLHAKIQQGLMVQAGMQREAARAVASEILRLVHLIQDAALNMASASKLAGVKLTTMYQDPIKEAGRGGSNSPSQGLKVN